MKMEKGITLISLVITIILLTILAGVGISTGIDSIAKSNVLKFKSDMRVIHTRVSELVEEEVLSIEQLNALGQPVPNVATTALNGKNPAEYRYFNKMGLERLGISGIDREIIINFSTKDVLDINGIEIDGEMVYDLPEWKDISFNDNNNQSPTFSLSKKNYGLNATILIENLQYGENTGRGSISYCFNDGIWHDIQSTEISVSVSGIYKVRVTNSAKNSTEHTINVTVANKPQLEEGMIPIVYDSTLSKWKTIGENSGTWYDYDPTENKWASVVVQENLIINNDGTIDSINESNIKLWIPRYMFYATNNVNELQVKYLKGTTNIATDNTNEQTSKILRYGLWAIPDTFSNSLTGVWVTKPSEATTIVGMLGIDLDDILPIGYLTENYSYTSSTDPDIKITIPKNFALLNSNDEVVEDTADYASIITDNNITTNGIVVRAKDGSEFVWVPVQDATDMYWTYNSQKVGQIYFNDSGNNFGTKKTEYQTTGGIGEPTVVSYDSGEANTLTTGETEEAKSAALLAQFQSEFDAMITSVIRYGGFYVGRYETSIINNKVKSVETTDTDNILTAENFPGKVQCVTNWYGLYSKAKQYASDARISSDVTSCMIWGCAYDQIMLWMQANNIDVKSTAQTQGNFSANYINTGSNDNYKFNNIYDLCGNYLEWTMTSMWSGRAVRGGYKGSTGDKTAMSSSEGIAPSAAKPEATTRIQLFINV